MPLLSDGDIMKVREMWRRHKADNRTRGDVPAPTGSVMSAVQDTQVLRVSSTTPTSGLYPAFVQEYDSSADTFTDMGACWVKPLNGESLTAGNYLGLREGPNPADDSPVYAVVLDFTVEQAQDAVGAILADTHTIDLTYDDVTPEITADARLQMSLTSDASGIKLSGDATSPGNNKGYTTDGSGMKGWHDVVPAAGGSYTGPVTYSNYLIYSPTTVALTTGSQVDIAVTVAGPVLLFTLTGDCSLYSINLTQANAFFQYVNTSSFTLTIVNDDGATGTASLRFTTPGGGNTVIPPGGQGFIWRNGSTSRWTVNPPSLQPGGTATGLITLKAGTTSKPSLRVPFGVAPTSPTAGDLYATVFGLFFYTGSAWLQFTDDHTELLNLDWITCGHTSLFANAIAGWNGAGATAYYFIGTDIQAWDADLDALAALGSTGIACRTAGNTWAQRSIATADSTHISVTNPAGVAGNPTLDIGTKVVTTDGSQTLTNKSIDATQLTGTIAAGRLPNPTSSTLGGVESIASVASQWVNSISTSGVPSLSQPAFSDLSGSLAASQLPALQTASLGSTLSLTGVAQAFKITVPFGNVKTAGTTNTVSVCVLPAGGEITSIKLFHDQFTGTGLTSLTALGKSSGGATYTANRTVSNAAADPPTYNSSFLVDGNQLATLTVQALFNGSFSGGHTLNDLTAGNLYVVVVAVQAG